MFLKEISVFNTSFKSKKYLLIKIAFEDLQNKATQYLQIITNKQLLLTVDFRKSSNCPYFAKCWVLQPKMQHFTV